MSKSVMIIDTPRDCCECPFGTMAFGKSICFLDEGNGIDCPLKPYKDFISIEWFQKYIDRNNPEWNYDFCYVVLKILEDWKKENEIDRCRYIKSKN